MKKCILLILAFVLMTSSNKSYAIFFPCMLFGIFILLYVLYDVLMKRTYKYFSDIGIMTTEAREEKKNSALENFSDKEIQNEFIRRFEK